MCFIKNVSIFLNANKTSKLKPFNPKYRTLRLKKLNLYSALVSSSSCIFFPFNPFISSNYFSPFISSTRSLMRRARLVWNLCMPTFIWEGGRGIQLNWVLIRKFHYEGVSSLCLWDLITHTVFPSRIFKNESQYFGKKKSLEVVLNWKIYFVSLLSNETYLWYHVLRAKRKLK